MPAAEPSSPGPSPIRVLILGGSSEATALATALAKRSDVAATLSLAGRTLAPAEQALATRIGGFGGATGLAAYLREQAIDVLVDATHPFAAQISANAREAAAQTGCRLLPVSRPAWAPQAGDDWREVATMAEAAAALGAAPRRVFLTIGRLQLTAFVAAPQHFYLVRTIDPVPSDHGLAEAEFVAARGPFSVEGEADLMRRARIDVLVTKNSGGAASGAKLEAARRLGLPVILVRRPDGAGEVLGVGGAVDAILAHRPSVRRGV